MKTTLIIAIILAVSLCTTAYILNRNFHGNVLIQRLERVERDMMALEDEYGSSERNARRVIKEVERKARRVIKEVKRIVEEGYAHFYAPFSHVIPISRGVLGIIEEKHDDTDNGN